MDKYQLTCQLQELFEHLDVSTVLDVGANEGQFGLFLRQEVGFKGTILSFEPAEGPFKILKEQSNKDTHWHCFFQALGSEDSTGTFNVMARSQFNSLLKPKNNVLFQDKNTIVECHDIDIITLNTLWPTLQEEHDMSSVYLKLDTQGFDLKVLQGSEDILPSIKALQSELSIIPIYQGMPTYKEVTDYLEKHNFSYSGMHPVSQDSQMKLIEFDGIFVNSQPSS